MVLCWSSLLQKLRQSWENIEQKKSTGVATDYMYVCMCASLWWDPCNHYPISLLFEYVHVQLNLRMYMVYVHFCHIYTSAYVRIPQRGTPW